MENDIVRNAYCKAISAISTSFLYRRPHPIIEAIEKRGYNSYYALPEAVRRSFTEDVVLLIQEVLDE